MVSSLARAISSESVYPSSISSRHRSVAEAHTQALSFLGTDDRSIEMYESLQPGSLVTLALVIRATTMNARARWSTPLVVHPLVVAFGVCITPAVPVADDEC